MAKAGTKKIVLLGVWIALLVGIVVWINLGSKLPTPPGPRPKGNPMPLLDPAKLEAQWPQIVAHAAAPPRGPAAARYTLAEFGDFQCPQCGKARPVLEKILAEHPAEINLIFLDRPFPNLHEWAVPSGMAAEVAAAQGRFWPMYDVLYAHQDHLEPKMYGDYAALAGLNQAAFQQAFSAGQGQDRLRAASQFADALGVQATPTLLVHDSVAKTVTVYVGMDTAATAEAGIPFAGLDKLIADPPWGK